MQAGKDATNIEDSFHMPRWKVLLYGQVLSVLLAIMWASQATLWLECSWSAPAFSCFWAYLLLSLHAIPLIKKGRSILKQDSGPAPKWFLGIIPLQTSPWTYLAMATLSFYGNYSYLLAVSLTTVTSISLIDAISVPTVMILSHIFLRRRYLKLHFIGAALCLSGVIIGVVVDLVANRIHKDTSYSDAYEKVDGSEEYPNKVVGDLLSCLGSILFGINDVLAEYSVHRFGGPTEYLAIVGIFGTCLSFIQALITERRIVVDTLNGITPKGCNSFIVGGLIAAYVVGQFSRKTGLASFLTISDAAMLQLSLLTSDLYTALFSIVYEHILPRPWSWVAMSIVMSGIVVYAMGPRPYAPKLHSQTNTQDLSTTEDETNNDIDKDVV
jgi:solute carrier family 35, member F1/2